jgi:hypothetical protein
MAWHRSGHGICHCILQVTQNASCTRSIKHIRREQSLMGATGRIHFRHTPVVLDLGLLGLPFK